jgi:hypothetical protein
METSEYEGYGRPDNAQEYSRLDPDFAADGPELPPTLAFGPDEQSSRHDQHDDQQRDQQVDAV